MKSIGEILKETRLAKGVELQNAAKETNISLRYIEALEDNSFDSFPGEAYLLGFLKSYAEFLGIDVERALSLYKNYRIVEEPTPMKELMKKDVYKVSPLLAAIAVLLAALGALSAIVAPKAVRKIKEAHMAKVAASIHEKREYVMEGQSFSGLFKEGDALSATIADKKHLFSLKKIDGKSILLERLDLPETSSERELHLQLMDEHFFALQGQPQADFMVHLEDVGLSGGQAVKLNFQMLGIGAASAAGPLSAGNADPVSEAVVTTPLAPIPAPGLQRQTVLSVRDPIRVDVTVSFRGYCYYRYRLDGRETVERYYQDGEQVQASVSSNYQMWLSNAGRTRLKIGLNEITLGKDGEPAVKILRWIRNSGTNMYELVLENVG